MIHLEDSFSKDGRGNDTVRNRYALVGFGKDSSLFTGVHVFGLFNESEMIEVTNEDQATSGWVKDLTQELNDHLALPIKKTTSDSEMEVCEALKVALSIDGLRHSPDVGTVVILISKRQRLGCGVQENMYSMFVDKGAVLAVVTGVQFLITPTETTEEPKHGIGIDTGGDRAFALSTADHHFVPYTAFTLTVYPQNAFPDSLGLALSLGGSAWDISHLVNAYFLSALTSQIIDMVFKRPIIRYPNCRVSQ